LIDLNRWFDEQSNPNAERLVYYEIISCQYYTNIVSLHPLKYYRIEFVVNDKDKVLKISALRVLGITLVIPPYNPQEQFKSLSVAAG
jgi:hypothetical protein